MYLNPILDSTMAFCFERVYQSKPASVPCSEVRWLRELMLLQPNEHMQKDKKQAGHLHVDNVLKINTTQCSTGDCVWSGHLSQCLTEPPNLCLTFLSHRMSSQTFANHECLSVWSYCEYLQCICHCVETSVVTWITMFS